MNKYLVLALVALIFTGITLFHQKQEKLENPSTGLMGEFQQWMRDYKQNFTAGEFMYRFSVFAENLREIQKTNAQNLSYSVGVNQFSALTKQEFIDTYLGTFPMYNTTDVEYTVTGSKDWRTQGAVTGVKNQGQCGSCWAFSTTGTVEGYSKIVKGRLQSFSESQLVDCSHDGNQGCKGGWPYKALGYVKSKGIQTESAYPYVPKTQSCKKEGGPFKISSVKRSSGCSTLVKDINSQPTSVCVDASNWSSYRSGVFSNCGTSINHAVLGVGYDASGNWLVKNSWGTSWGMSGYITLKKGNSCGVCSNLANAY